MKLRNKKTGKIYEIPLIQIPNLSGGNFSSLSSLNEEFEDYEEPKEYWYINTVLNRVNSNYRDSRDVEDDKTIGNYFETKEEAELALRKLKAWKRLKDARFEFGTIKYNLDEKSSSTIAYDGIITIKGIAYEDFVDDLDLLFGGEE